VRVDLVKLYSDVSQAEAGSSVAVIVDILRATTSIAHFLAAGAKSVMPADGHDAGFALRRELTSAGGGGGRVILAGESSGLPVEGFDFGNSPVAIDAGDFAGATVVLSTTNGTRALNHYRAAERTYAGSFNNGPGLVRTILRDGAGRVIVACSGDSGRFSPEDHWGAGYIAEALVEGGAEPSPDAEEAVRAWRKASDDLAAALRETPHGGDLVSLGLGDDLDAAALIGSHDVVPIMRGRELVRAAGDGPGSS